MAQVRRKEMQQMRQVNSYMLLVAFVMKNVFSHLWNTDSDMSNCCLLYTSDAADE